MNTDLVDILTPPNFEKSGVTKLRLDAYRDRDWTGVGNLWILQNKPFPAILYHQKSAAKSWEPGKVGVIAGGHYRAGEGIEGLLRETKEEIGRTYNLNELKYLGRRLYVGLEKDGKGVRQNVVDIFMVIDNSPIENYTLEPKEVAAICAIPISQLTKMYEENDYSFNVDCISHSGRTLTIKISRESFPDNWDNYHKRMVYIAKNFLRGETDLRYYQDENLISSRYLNQP